MTGRQMNIRNGENPGAWSATLEKPPVEVILKPGLVVSFDDSGSPVALIEKPKGQVAGLAVPGMYFYDEQVLSIAARQRPSGRGEMEITYVNAAYLAQSQLYVERIMRGVAWLDGGTPEDLFEAGQLVRILEERTGLRIACPEEVALRKGFIDVHQLKAVIATYPKGKYSTYLSDLASSTEVAADRPVVR